MNKKLLLELLNLGIFKSERVSKDEYDSFRDISKDSNYEYIQTENASNGAEQYEKVDKQNLTNDEILILLEIKKLKSIKAIMYMVGFFFSLAVLYIVLMILGII